jgi:hypothetical protein
MRWLLALSLVGGIVATAVGSATATNKPVQRAYVFKTATGTIAKLDFAQIQVGRATCSLDRKSAILTGNFAVGEHVTIGCSGDVLRTIKLQPITSGHAASVPVIHGASGVPPASGSSGTLVVPTSSVSARGQITSITMTTITVSGVTCPFNPSIAPPSLSQLQVGDTVSIGCNTYPGGITASQIAITHTPPPTD